MAEKNRSFLGIAVLVVALGLVIAICARTFLLQIYSIPSESMEDTLQIGDRVFVSPLDYRLGSIERGDVVVFDGRGSFLPEGAAGPFEEAADFVRSLTGDSKNYFVKRVIGLPGDQVECCDTQGRLLVNGLPLTEDYLYPGDEPSRQKFSVVVPPDRLWMMGDHRSNSADSRAHLGDPGGGMVPVDRVAGKVFLRFWPFDRWTEIS